MEPGLSISGMATRVGTDGGEATYPKSFTVLTNLQLATDSHSLPKLINCCTAQLVYAYTEENAPYHNIESIVLTPHRNVKHTFVRLLQFAYDVYMLTRCLLHHR